MTIAEKLNLFLLVMNNNFSIVIVFLLISAVSYIAWQIQELGLPLHRLVWNIPLGIGVAMALSTDHFGNLIVRIAVASWRAMGGDDPWGQGQLVAIGVGSIIGLFGLFWLIRFISRPRFGERMWLTALALAAVNTIITVYLFLPA
jgi:hypothetical protein